MDFADKMIKNKDEIMRRTLKEAVESDKIRLIKVSLKDRDTDKSMLTAYKLLWEPRLDSISLKAMNKTFNSLDRLYKDKIISAIIRQEMPYITNVFDKTKHKVMVYELDWNEESFSNKEISNILSSIEAEPEELQNFILNITYNIINDLGITPDKDFKIKLWGNI